MKKITIILMALLVASFLFISCQKAKEPEGKKEEQAQEKQLTQQIQKEEINKQLFETKQPIAQETTFKRPAGCDEAYKNYLKKANEQITEKEKEYLIDICKIPIRRHGEDKLGPIKWWRDEYGYEDLISEAFLYYLNMEKSSDIKPEYIEPIKNIALNSKYPKLRQRAISVLYGIDKKKYIPLFKEVLRREVEERKITKREITEQSGLYPIRNAGWILTKEGEYEYAFPNLMKAKVFDISAKRKDGRAIPYMYKALKDKDPHVRIDSAWWLAEIGERSEDIYVVVAEFAKKENAQAIVILGKLGDKRGIPILENVIKDRGDSYIGDEAKKAIGNIEGKHREIK